MDYLVQWEIELSADTPEEAAQAALEIMRDPESTALFFKVIHDDGHLIDVDLREENE